MNRARSTLKGVYTPGDGPLRTVSLGSNKRANQQQVAAALIDLQNRTDNPATWTTSDKKTMARDNDRARAAARDEARNGNNPETQPHKPDLRIIPGPAPDLADEFDFGDLEPLRTFTTRPFAAKNG